MIKHEPSPEALSSIQLTLKDLGGKIDEMAARYVWDRHILPTIIYMEDDFKSRKDSDK